MELRIEQQANGTERWVEIDLWGKRLAGKLAGLDVEIGDWLLAARDEDVHRRLGYGSFVEYVQRRLGFERHTIGERVRVAEALRRLPLTRAALARGERPWAAVRELSRVAVAETEAKWLDDTAGQRASDVQRLVAGRRPGQTPEDPADPRLVRHVLRLEVSAEAFALFREAVRALQRSVDPQLGDEQALAEMSRRILGGPGDDGRAPYQVALVQCEDCRRVWQDARGETIEVAPEVAERAACDGQFIGRLETSPQGRTASPEGRTDSRSASPRGRTQATQTIPPATRRQVLRRDHGRCRVPGCCNASWIEVHHLRLRSEQGDHDPRNLAAICACHHDRIHDGFLLVEGDAEAELTFRHVDGSVYGSDASPQLVSVHGAAYGALRQLGFRETESKQALAKVRSLRGLDASLEEVIRLALAELSSGPGGAR